MTSKSILFMLATLACASSFAGGAGPNGEDTSTNNESITVSCVLSDVKNTKGKGNIRTFLNVKGHMNATSQEVTIERASIRAFNSDPSGKTKYGWDKKATLIKPVIGEYDKESDRIIIRGVKPQITLSFKNKEYRNVKSEETFLATVVQAASAGGIVKGVAPKTVKCYDSIKE